MNYPNASIIVATLNNAAILRKVLKAMLKLDYPAGYEVIVVNDGSKDNTREMLKEFANEKRIKVFNIERSGVCRARNTAINAARFPIIVNMDHDCIPEKIWLKKITAPFADPKVGATTSFGGYGGTSTAFRKKPLQEAGGYDEDYFYYREDTDLVFKVIERGYKFVDVGAEEGREYYLHDHELAKPRGIIGHLKHGWERVKYHKNDVLLYKKHPNKVTRDFLHIKLGFIVDPRWDFAVATGLWRENGEFELWSPRGISYLKNRGLVHMLAIIFAGTAYAVLVKLVRLYGSLKFGKLLI